MEQNKKRERKDIITFSITKELNKQFSEYCEKNSLNRSALIKNFIEQFLKENKNPK